MFSNSLDAKKLQKIAFVVALLGLVMPAIAYLIGNHLEEEYLDTLSKIGDWLGGTTSPWIGLAGFIMIVAAYMAQQEEIKLNRQSLDAQKEELQLTRQEMELTRKEFEEQNLTLARQQFENTFFQLLSLHHTIVKDIEFGDPNQIYRGRQYFSIAHGLFLLCYDNARRGNGIVSGQYFNPQTDIECLILAYQKFYVNHQDYVGHYFRNLYHIIKLIDNTEGLDEMTKRGYASIVRAQLSTYEIIMLFYNAMVGHGYLKFRPLIDKYDLLQNMNQTIINKGHFGYYNDPGILDVLHKKHKIHD